MSGSIQTGRQSGAGPSGALAIVKVAGAIVWPSFFAAGVAAMVFFAIVDPVDLADITWPHATISREFGYTLGFFMFWMATLASSAFSVLLLGHVFATAHRKHDERNPP